MHGDYKIFRIILNKNHNLYVFEWNCYPTSDQQLQHTENLPLSATATSFKLVNKWGTYQAIHLSKLDFEYVLEKLQTISESNIHHPKTDEKSTYLLENIAVKELCSPFCRTPHSYMVIAGSRRYILNYSDILDLIEFKHKFM